MSLTNSVPKKTPGDTFLLLEMEKYRENRRKSCTERIISLQRINAGSKIKASKINVPPPQRPYEKINAAGVHFRKYGNAIIVKIVGSEVDFRILPPGVSTHARSTRRLGLFILGNF